jgi:hypothetical protein
MTESESVALPLGDAATLHIKFALCGALYIIAEKGGFVKPFFEFFCEKMRFLKNSLFV